MAIRLTASEQAAVLSASGVFIAVFSHFFAWAVAVALTDPSLPWSLLLAFNLVLVWLCAVLGRRAGIEHGQGVRSEGVAQSIATLAPVAAQALIIGLLLILDRPVGEQMSSVAGNLILDLSPTREVAAAIYLSLLIGCAFASVLTALFLPSMGRWKPLTISVPILLLTASNLLLIPWLDDGFAVSNVVLLVLLVVGLAFVLSHLRFVVWRLVRFWRDGDLDGRCGPLAFAGLAGGFFAVGLVYPLIAGLAEVLQFPAGLAAIAGLARVLALVSGATLGLGALWFAGVAGGGSCSG